MFQWWSSEKRAPAQSVILDLDESCLHTMGGNERIPPEVKDAPEFKSNHYSVTTREGTFWGVKRPHLDEFIEYCQYRFNHVGIWSAGKAGYVAEIVKILNPSRPFACVFNYDQCDQVHTEYPNDDGSVSYNMELWKPLNMLFEKQPHQFNRYNTWVVDDRQDYAKENLLNWVPIPAFSPSVKKLLPQTDDYLLRLMDWFEQEDVKYAANVLEVNKNWY